MAQSIIYPNGRVLTYKPSVRKGLVTVDGTPKEVRETYKKELSALRSAVDHEHAMYREYYEAQLAHITARTALLKAVKK